MGIKGNSELADITRSRVGIENFVESDRVGTVGVDDFALFKFEMNTIERSALVNGRCIVGNLALNGFFNWARKDLAVRNVMAATTGYGADALIEKRKSQSGPFSSTRSVSAISNSSAAIPSAIRL